MTGDLGATGGFEAKAASNDILLIEDSVALSTLLARRLSEELGANVTRCASLEEARAAVAQRSFALALTGLNLPDAPSGEILPFLTRHALPAIVFTATFDPNAGQRYAQHKIIDYIVKDGRRTVDLVVRTVGRILSNSAFNVLVVDDARSVRSGLVDILRRQNFNVFEAHSGNEALSILSSRDDIELVITDYHMADMDGYELTRQIRARKDSEAVRIIGISSSNDRLLSASFLKAGASDFIYRPFVPEELQCRIDNNIETLVQLKRLRRLAERDHLTGLANRRHFFEQVKEHEARGTGGAVALLDIDHFKSVNDTFGHGAGDRVLKAVSDLMATTCRAERYIPARLGGEEFAIYMPNANAFQAHSCCESLRKSVEGNVVPVTTAREISVTISIGVVEIEVGEPFANQLQAADQLLYLAKTNGRNRVYSDLTIPEAIGA